jgi:hypothetical protein
MLAEDGQSFSEVALLLPLNHQCRQDPVGIPSDDGSEQTLLVLEYVLDIALRSAGALDDRVYARRRVALFEKDLGSSLEKRLPACALSPRSRFDQRFDSLWNAPLVW